MEKSQLGDFKGVGVRRGEGGDFVWMDALKTMEQELTVVAVEVLGWLRSGFTIRTLVVWSSSETANWAVLLRGLEDSLISSSN